MSFRFLHLADLHLETRFGGRPETCDRLRRATLEAFERAVDYAIQNRLHAVLAAGDLFDDARLSTRTELFFVGQLRRLAEAGVWFLAACGNHDPGGAGFRRPLGDLGARAFFRDGGPGAVKLRPRRRRGGSWSDPAIDRSEWTNLAARLRDHGSLPWGGLRTRRQSRAARQERYAPLRPRYQADRRLGLATSTSGSRGAGLAVYSPGISRGATAARRKQRAAGGRGVRGRQRAPEASG